MAMGLIEVNKIKAGRDAPAKLTFKPKELCHDHVY